MFLLQNLCIPYPDDIILGQLNINSSRKKYEMLSSLEEKNTDFFTVSKRKLGSSFTSSQCLISGFLMPYKTDRKSRGGKIHVFITDSFNDCLIKNVFLATSYGGHNFRTKSTENQMVNFLFL